MNESDLKFFGTDKESWEATKTLRDTFSKLHKSSQDHTLSFHGNSSYVGRCDCENMSNVYEAMEIIYSDIRRVLLPRDYLIQNKRNFIAYES